MTVAIWRSGGRGLSCVRRALLIAVALIAAALIAAALTVAAGPTAAVGVEQGGDEAIAITIDAGTDRGGLQWSSAARVGGAVDLGSGSEAVLVWDLTALDPAAYRSDLVRIEVIDAPDPGAVTATATAPHGRRAIVFDGGEGGTSVVQVGRRTEHALRVDGAGRRAIRMRASISLVRGGTAETEITLLLGSGSLAGPPDGTTSGARSAGDPSRRDPAAAEDDVAIAVVAELAEDAGEPAPDDPGAGGPLPASPGGGGGSGVGSVGDDGGAEPQPNGARPPLAATGVELGFAVAVAIGLLALGGIVLALARRVRESENHSRARRT